MKDFKHRRKLDLALLALPLGALLAAGCSHKGGGGTTYYSSSTSPAYAESSGAPVRTEPEQTPITPTTRDAGPGTPVGDQTSADTSEGQTQGAGSRAQLSPPTAPPPAETRPGATASQAPLNPPPAPQAAPGNVVIPLYKETVNVGKRQVDQGAIRLRKTVRTEIVSQPVEVRTESVTIERLPAQNAPTPTGNSATGQPFQNQEYVIHLRGEQPFVQTQVVPAGEIVARKQFQMQQTNLQAQVRREEIAVDKGNARNVNVAPNVYGPAGGGGEVGGQTSGTGYSTGKEITDLTSLTSASNPEKLYGQKVRLSGVKIQKVWDPQLVTIAGEENQPIFVHLRHPAMEVKEGDTLTLNGTVKECSRAKNAEQGLSPQAAQKLMQQPFFVDAENWRINQS